MSERASWPRGCATAIKPSSSAFSRIDNRHRSRNLHTSLPGSLHDHRPVLVILCRTMGPVELSVDGGPAPPELLWRKHLALLVYLARSPRGRTREHLVGLLWPEKPERDAR